MHHRQGGTHAAVQDRFEVESAAAMQQLRPRTHVVISIIEDRQTEDTPKFATSNRDIAAAIASINLMDSDRNVEILRVLNDVFDSIENTSTENR